MVLPSKGPHSDAGVIMPGDRGVLKSVEVGRRGSSRGWGGREFRCMGREPQWSNKTRVRVNMRTQLARNSERLAGGGWGAGHMM